MMKRTVGLVAAVALVFTLIFSITAFAKQEVKIKLGQETISLGEKPFFEKGRIMVPLKTFAEAVGAEVTWDAKKDTVWVNKDKMHIEIPLGKDTLYIRKDGDTCGVPEERKMDVSAKVVENTSFIPVAIIAACLDLQVSWDAKNKTVVVEKAGDVKTGETPLPYEFVGEDEIKGNGVLAAWYEKNHKIAGIHFTTQQHSTYVIISGGEKPTGGYKMEIERVTLVSPEKAYISALLLKPAPDMMATQAMTYPHALIKLESDQIRRVDGQTKEDLARKTFGEMGYDIGAKDVQSIEVYNLEQVKIKGISKEDFAMIMDNLNKSTIVDNPFIEMIAGNMVKIILTDNSTISLTSYGSQTNYVATIQVSGAYSTYHLVNPKIAGLLLEKN